MTTTQANLLDREKSPYLLQHKDNPIWWRAWGEEAFQIARDEKKPVFLSIGYSTCHWCHVMAHESFEDEGVADVLNRGFICIKVDREEHPDVDQVYMSALQAISGGGGWPMSVWLTSEGKPFFAGTYFPKARFVPLLERILEIWSSEPDKLREDSERMLQSIRELENVDAREGSMDSYREFLSAYTSHFQHHFDMHYGGFGGAPKFPQTMNLMVMMRQDLKSGLRQAEALIGVTLSNMVRGGIYDHLAGGFHRYSVDERWLVPHFEKMLYDQAMIATTLVEAHQLYGDPELERAARETFEYVIRDMTNQRGGFYSAQDADSLDPRTGEKEEGYFCTYTYDELSAALTGDELKRVEEVYGVRPAGCFEEGRNILHLQEGYDRTVKNEPAIQSAFEKLRRLRASRPLPHLDDKVIAAWNGWMIGALARGGMALAEPRYVEAARRALRFAHESLWREGRLARFWRDGEARGTGVAEDYASLLHACLEVSQADPDPLWAEWAMQLQAALDSRFWDESEGLYFANDGSGTLLPLRPKDIYDGVTPSSNSMQAYNLARLFVLAGDSRFDERARRIASRLFGRLGEYPSSLSYLALALDFMVTTPKVCVLSGNGWVREWGSHERRRFHPSVLWVSAGSGWPIASDKEGDRVYVCEAGQCRAPARSAAEVVL